MCGKVSTCVGRSKQLQIRGVPKKILIVILDDCHF